MDQAGILEVEFVFYCFLIKTKLNQTFPIPGFRCLQNPWKDEWTCLSEAFWGPQTSHFWGVTVRILRVVLISSQSKSTKLWLVGLEIWTILKTSPLCLLGWTSRVILHQLIGRLSHYLQGFIHLRWCRISSINSIKTSWCFEKSQSNWIISPTFWGEHEHIFEKPAPIDT